MASNPQSHAPLQGIWCASIYTPRPILGGCGLVFDDGLIAEVTCKRRPDMLDVSADGAIVVPGLVDIQVNGALGFSFQAQDGAHFDAIVDFHLRAGTTTFLPTLITAAEDVLLTSLDTLARYLDAPRLATLPCIHLEGPFLAADKRGAHNGADLRAPDSALMQRFCAAAHDRLGLVTLAPELPGSLDMIAWLTQMGITVAAGHSAATFAEMQAACAAGLRMVTHAGNASDWPHRALNLALDFLGSEPGVVGALLALPELRGSVIMDGFHMHPALLSIFLKCKNADHILLTSDASTVAGCAAGDYAAGGLAAHVDARGFARSLRGGYGLAGSTVTLLTALQRAATLGGASLEQAVTMATQTPAQLLKLDLNKGVLTPGADADLLVLNSDLSLRHVIVKGNLL